MPDDDTPDATARPGGEAAGGSAAKPGDPDTPADARRRHATDAERHARAGFGDDKGGDAE